MFGFVILHYKNFIETKKCLDSILMLKNQKEVKILLVDNFSNDGSAEKLEKIYEKNKNFAILYNNENYGFSKGNNLGCSEILKNYDIDYLCVINNDTIILQKDFCIKIKNSFEENLFDILGPDIIGKDSIKQNPFRTLENISEVKENIKEIKNIKYKAILKFCFPFLQLITNFCKRKLVIKKSLTNQEKENEEVQKNIGLHGSFMVFSKKYIKKYQKIIPEYTFMYGEEHFITYRRIKNNLNVIYDPRIKIFHNEGSSTSLTIKNNLKKTKFVCHHMMISRKILLDFFEKNQEFI
ncbi:MAG: glycosyltransferase [Cetobacterium sp.]